MTKTKKQLRAEAVERLKNCVAARFDAESIVIALTSGRHGQSDWSLECDKLIYLLTDDANDDSTPEKVVSGSEPFLTPLSSTNGTGNGDDSREKLEADVRKIAEAYNMDTQRHGTERFAHELFHSIIHLLDRQAAITDAEWEDELEQLHIGYKPLIDELQAKVDELTAERDNWEANCEDWKKDCERYRELFGKCLDYADAIHALMDDEGMA